MATVGGTPGEIACASHEQVHLGSLLMARPGPSVARAVGPSGSSACESRCVPWACMAARHPALTAPASCLQSHLCLGCVRRQAQRRIISSRRRRRRRESCHTVGPVAAARAVRAAYCGSSADTPIRSHPACPRCRQQNGGCVPVAPVAPVQAAAARRRRGRLPPPTRLPRQDAQHQPHRRQRLRAVGCCAWRQMQNGRAEPLRPCAAAAVGLKPHRRSCM